MKFSIDVKYKENVTALSKKKLKKYQCIFDLNSTQKGGFELEESFMRVWYMIDGNITTHNYDYKKLKYCIVRSNGYVIIFKDKKYIFLPVTDNKKENNKLLEIGEYFHNNYTAFRFSVTQRLSLPEDSNKKSKKRVGFDKADSPWIMIGMAIVAALMSIVFITMPRDYKSISREEAVSYEGQYDSYREGSKDYVYITLADETEYTIHQICVYGETLDSLDRLQKGEKLYVLVNPKTEYVVELKTESNEILNFEKSQADMQREAKWFMWLGIAIDIGGVYLLIYGIYQLIKERKEDK